MSCPFLAGWLDSARRTLVGADETLLAVLTRVHACLGVVGPAEASRACSCTSSTLAGRGGALLLHGAAGAGKTAIGACLGETLGERPLSLDPCGQSRSS